jgi:AraC-like DNA-binding protein
VWRSSGQKVSNLVIESPPSGYCSIVFNSGGDYFLNNKKYERLTVPKQFISGQSIYSYKLFFDDVIDLTGIVLKPTGLASLFDLPTYQYTEERIPLNSVFNKKMVTDMSRRVFDESHPNERVKLLDNFLIKHYNDNKPVADYIDAAANMIIEKNGMVDVADIMENVFMSRRNFERKFFKKVGLSPKYYARLRRIGYTLNLIAGKKKVDWGELFSRCEFYDQSHFIKDFLEFTGRTPQQYLEENTELANIIDKPTMNDIRY